MNILFVCTGNTCRSSMAEALFNDMLKQIENKYDKIKVSSAGIFAVDDMPASSQAIIAMKSRGIDLKKHKSKVLTKQMIEDADLILTMTARHKNSILGLDSNAKGKVFTLKEYSNSDEQDLKDICDPFGQPVEKYMETAKEIKDALEKVLRKIKSGTNDNFTEK